MVHSFTLVRLFTNRVKCLEAKLVLASRLKRIEALSISLASLIIAFSFFAVVYSPKNVMLSTTGADIPDGKAFLFPMSLILGVNFNGRSNLLNQSTRMSIYNFVKINPGTHFRDLCNSSSLPIGVVQYHVGLLTRAGLLSVRRDGRYKRYFESKRFTETEMEIISILRHATAGKVLAILMEKQGVYHKELATRLHISSQALTWQINHLKKTGLVNSLTEGMRVKYFLNGGQRATVGRCLEFIS